MKAGGYSWVVMVWSYLAPNKKVPVLLNVYLEFDKWNLH